MRFWTTSPRYRRLRVTSISIHNCATSIKMSPRKWLRSTPRGLKLMRQLQINGLRPPRNLELLQFLANIRISNEIRLMRPSTVAARLARGSNLRRSVTSDVESRKRTRGFRPRSVSVITVKCWNCGDAGHTSQSCSKPRDEATVANRGKKRRTVGAVERKRERRRLARIVLPVGEVQLRS
jgi:hypothetical protein